MRRVGRAQHTMNTSASLVTTPTSIFATLEVAKLVNGKLQIPRGTTLVAIEIGLSDRDVMDKRWLPAHPHAFLVSCEPLLDKYARALARAPAGGDSFQRLGHHHDRGVALPVAVGPVAGASNFRVSSNAGCSSMLPTVNSNRQASWCSKVMEFRSVPTITLETILGWLDPRPVELLKIDAQGMDLEVVRSGFSRLHQVRRFSLEVVSDECEPLYDSQPTCSTVVRVARQLGFAPASPNLACTCRFPRKRENSMCEMDVLFVAHGVAPSNAFGAEPNYAQFDRLFLNGCTRLLPSDQLKKLSRNPPDGEAVMIVTLEPGGRFPLFTFYSQAWKGPKFESYGLPYTCDQKHFRKYAGSALESLHRKQNATTAAARGARRGVAIRNEREH